MITFDVESVSFAAHDWDGEKWITPKGGASIKNIGAFRYWEHPSADVLCAHWIYQDGERDRWVQGDPLPYKLLKQLDNGELIEFHNAMFERLAWHYSLTKKHGWPPLNIANVRCSMAKAMVAGWPAGLEKLAEAMGLRFKKDPIGKELMQIFSIPRNPSNGDDRTIIRPTDTEPVRFRGEMKSPVELFEMFNAYCEQDVIVQREASQKLPAMTAEELSAWQLDQEMNWNGIALNVPAIDDCIAVLEEATEAYKDESERTGVKPKDIDRYLSSHDNPRLRTIGTALKRTGVKKLYAMQSRVSSDGRLRGMFMHHGCRTGRPTGLGVQTTNLVKEGAPMIWTDCCHVATRSDVGECPRCGKPTTGKEKQGWDADMVPQVLYDMKQRQAGRMEQLYGEPIQVISGCIRSMLRAGEGCDLISSDYSMIEAIVSACLCREDWRIKVFQDDIDIYLASASAITGNTIDYYLDYKKKNGVNHPDRNKIGKVAELALGYGGGVKAWRQFDPDQAQKSDGDIKLIIGLWRRASPRIADAWIDVEEAFIKAFNNPDIPVSFLGMCSFLSNGRDVTLILPSSRNIIYHDVLASRGEITFKTNNTNPSAGCLGWARIRTWGSKLYENIIQAISHDIMRNARRNLFICGYPVVQEVYDEAVCEVKEGFGSVEELECIMNILPSWAKLPYPNSPAWPIKAKGGWRGKFYRKS